MSFKFVGKTSPYTGNLLFEILNNLKYYGLGRVVVRNSYKKFPELSFYVIRKVIAMRELIGTGPDELVFGKVWVDEVFRGRKLEGLQLLTKVTYLPDFHLIPKDEEEKYLTYEPKIVVKTLPKYDTLPPALAKMIKNKTGKEPSLKVVYEDLPPQYDYKIAEQGETPDYKLKIQIPDKFFFGMKT